MVSRACAGTWRDVPAWMMRLLLAAMLALAVGGCSLFAAAARRGEHHDPPQCPGFGAPLADLVGTLATLSLAVVATSALRDEGGVATEAGVVLIGTPVLY